MGKEVQQQIALNLLSEGTQITGDLHASNDIRIDGELKGKIFTKGRLVIGQMAKVEGEVNSPNVDILGTMEGNIVSTGCFLEGKVGIHGNDQSGLYRDRVRSGF